MQDRLIDQQEFINESKLFYRRENYYFLFASLFFSGVFLAGFYVHYFINQDEVLVNTIILASTVLALFVFCCYVFRSYNDTISAVELQNALFCGIANISTSFCAIVRNNGSIVYVSPEFRTNFNINKIKLGDDIKALCDIFKLDDKDFEKIVSSIKNSQPTVIRNIEVQINNDKRSLAFSLEPIGIYPYNNNNKMTLAVQTIERPSGYHFISFTPTENEEICDLKIDNLNIGAYFIDSKAKLSSFNGVFTEMTAITKLDISAKKVRANSFIYSIKASKIINNLDDEWKGTTFLRHKNGKIVKVFIFENFVKDSSFNIIGKRGLVFPMLAESNEGEDATFSIKEEKMPDLVLYSPIATAVLDKDGYVVKCNKSFANLCGHSDRTSKIGWNLFDSMENESLTQTKKYFENILDEKDDGLSPIDITIKSDTKTMASLYLSRLTNIDDDNTYLISHMIDTTELKNLELRFVHSQKMQAIGQLAGGIAHDFNNLLTAIMGFCDLLLMRHPAGDQSFADLMQIKQNANRAANLVRQLLAFSRKQTLQPEVIRITDILADLSNLIRRLIGENIELKMVHGRNVSSVKVDQGQLEQVIINLAVNARDAMTEGGILMIRTSNVKIDKTNNTPKNLIAPTEDEIIKDGTYVKIEIVDTGQGIEKEHIGKIFEPFYSTKEIGSGTGLGLSTVYGIIKQTDGYIFVSSKVGKGTKFTIFLKLYSDERSNLKGKKLLDSDLGGLNSADLVGEGNVLLVEDETPVRIFSSNALKNKGYNVLEADCAESALEIVNEKGDMIDIIVTDVVMPGMSGTEMVEEIYKKYPTIKVIFVSGYAEDTFLKAYGEDREFNFLSKPYTLKQLATKVKEVLKNEISSGNEIDEGDIFDDEF